MDIFKKHKIVWMIFIAVVILSAAIIAIVINIISKNGFMSDSCFTTMSVENSTFNSWDMKYAYLNGTQHRNIKLNSGEELSVNYSSRVKKGALKILLLSPEKKNVKNLLDDNSGKFEYKASESGTFYLKIVGNKTEGQFNLDWKIKK
ncbi:hypothetical protein [Clostridium hydrogenum]|uniref:hypothetical protein n=1 Tax=Clostridium hydrogenum TaxID=2855764 RepID=UPI001F3512D6|nr:hypothetical protein [Clostridium hydrogenum]